MLRMPTTYVSPPTATPVFYQQDATPTVQYEQADHTASADLIWHGAQTSTISYFQQTEAISDEPNVVRPHPSIADVLLRPSSGLLRFIQQIALVTMLGVLLPVAGCKKKEQPKRITRETLNARKLPDSAFYIGESSKRKLPISNRIRKYLIKQARERAWDKMTKGVRKRLIDRHPTDCRRKGTQFPIDVWHEHSFHQEMRSPDGKIYYRFRYLWNEASCVDPRPVGGRLTRGPMGMTYRRVGRSVDWAHNIPNSILSRFMNRRL